MLMDVVSPSASTNSRPDRGPQDGGSRPICFPREEEEVGGIRSVGERYDVPCCIAGCGPAGAVLAYLLARAGVDVLVLEKHGDFLRDFRGDTIHPSTLEILDEVGLADRFLRLPHSRVATFTLLTAPGEAVQIDLRGLHTRFPFIAFVPQWDFLRFITAEASRYPGFRLMMNAEAVDLLKEGERVLGLRYRTAAGEAEVRALLTVGADGRTSRTREAAGLPQITTSPPLDVFWFRLSRRAGDSASTNAVIGPGHFVVLIDRGEYWQIGYAITKGQAEAVRLAGLEAFRQSIASVVPVLADRVEELQDWEQIKLLTVRADRLTRWYRPGYLAIGDAAHAMSPVAGVGINVAIQDATAAANVLWQPLRRGEVPVRDLARVQQQRELSVRIIQAVQAAIHRGLIQPVLASGTRPPAIPPLLRFAMRTPGIRGLLPRLIAFGIYRPHVQSPELATPLGDRAVDGRAR
jgi:2-polyprenyl-6-methoxyphenol hydroxylase-like FAD-dependent oxidoreductase